MQVYNRVHVEYLPTYEPSEDEKRDPDLYASNVRALMAKASGRIVCNHSNYDALYVHSRHPTNTTNTTNTSCLMLCDFASEHALARVAGCVPRCWLGGPASRRTLFATSCRRWRRRRRCSTHTGTIALSSASRSCSRTPTAAAPACSRSRTCSRCSATTRTSGCQRRSSASWIGCVCRLCCVRGAARVADRRLSRAGLQDGDGQIDWRNLLLCVGMETVDVPSEELFGLAFEIFDQNSSNKIDTTELKTILGKMSKYRSDVEGAVRNCCPMRVEAGGVAWRVHWEVS